jgi:toxin HigB-1
MIRTWKHKGLRDLFETGRTRHIEQKYTQRVAAILAHLDAARVLSDMDQPSYALHHLRPMRPNTWSVTVKQNWRVTFVFENGDAYDVDFEDYHGKRR